MENELVQSAKDYAFSMHKNRYGKHPYSHHLNMVVDELLEIIEFIPKENQPILIAAAYLHDVVEDCPETNISIIEDRFGKEVADTVWALTNDTGKRASNEYYQKIMESKDKGASIIKFCDRIANIKHCLNRNEEAEFSFSKLAMYMGENESFMEKIGYTTSTDTELYIKIIEKLKLKLFHLFYEPIAPIQQEFEVNKNVRKLDISVKFFDYGSNITTNVNENDFTPDDIVGALTLIVSSLGSIIKQTSKQNNKNNEQPGTN